MGMFPVLGHFGPKMPKCGRPQITIENWALFFFSIDIPLAYVKNEKISSSSFLKTIVMYLHTTEKYGLPSNYTSALYL